MISCVLAAFSRMAIKGLYSEELYQRSACSRVGNSSMTSRRGCQSPSLGFTLPPRTTNLPPYCSTVAPTRSRYSRNAAGSVTSISDDVGCHFYFLPALSHQGSGKFKRTTCWPSGVLGHGPELGPGRRWVDLHPTPVTHRGLRVSSPPTRRRRTFLLDHIAARLRDGHGVRSLRSEPTSFDVTTPRSAPGDDTDGQASLTRYCGSAATTLGVVGGL
jgi:hypothetical protein